jgi:hypothetical protein
MDEKAIRRAALITLRRAILQSFPPGAERRKRLRWLAAVARNAKLRVTAGHLQRELAAIADPTALGLAAES